ncbi:MAG: orotate phosphoribosyltransferase [Alphaproteobacteria bacterium]|nr:orotate phosphoribosyltransferase [Alphaproteobacteria bacterium]
MNREDVIKEFEAAGAILKGHFILSSGLHSDTYLQCARVLMDPRRADKLCAALAAQLNAKFGIGAFDLVVSPAMGGVIVGYEMGRQLGIPSVFVERVEGSLALRRGFEIPEGTRVLVVEDVVTTGKSSKETFACIAEHGGKVLAEASLVDRTDGEADLGVPLIALLGLKVQAYEADKLPEHLQSIPAVKPGSRWLKAA